MMERARLSAAPPAYGQTDDAHWWTRPTATELTPTNAFNPPPSRPLTQEDVSFARPVVFGLAEDGPVGWLFWGEHGLRGGLLTLCEV